MVERILMWIGILALLFVVGSCMNTLGLGRATQGDVRAIQRQIEERCR